MPQEQGVNPGLTDHRSLNRRQSIARLLSTRRNHRLGCGSHWARLLVGSSRFLLPHRFLFLACLLGLSVGHIAELLHPAGEDLRSEDAILLIDGQTGYALKHTGEKSVATETDQQLRFLVEDLDAILLSIDHPDVVIAIDGNALGTREVSWAVAGFAKGGDELAIAIEDLNAVVEGVGHVEIAFAIHRQARRPGKVAR